MSKSIGPDPRIDAIFKQHFSKIGEEVLPTQREVIESVLKGKNTLALMPTGSGKSLCYWIAGLALGGITVAVFPLTALMDEQAEKLEAFGLKVVKLHAGVDSKTQYQQLIELYHANTLPNFIMVSPERLASDGFLEHVLRHVRSQIKLVVIDEAHCVSQWGLDFRPFYKEIPFFLHSVFEDKPLPPRLCLTATLNPQDQKQICTDFDIPPENVIRHEMLLRQGIDIRIEKVPDEQTKTDLFWALLAQHQNEKVLIYIDRKYGKRSTEGLCDEAIARGMSAAYFHADLPTKEKMAVVQRFRSGEIRTVFATSAFGMGIDIPDIRGVIHFLLPESTEQFYQQIGRVGRDGKPAWAVLFYSDKNVKVRKQDFIERSFPVAADFQMAFKRITDDGRIGRLTLTYFDEADEVQSAFHYIVRSKVIMLVCKGVRSLSAFKPKGGFSLPAFDRYREATINGILPLTASKLGVSEAAIMRDIYEWVATEKLVMQSAPTKCWVIECKAEALPDDMLAEIMADVEQRKAHRYALFDEFVSILERYTHSDEIHFQIGEYLGIDRFNKNRIYETLSGDNVRSKSEVIIANILYQAGINFKYEKRLVAADGSSRLPDFTIEHDGKTWYLEHLGMLDRKDYALEWVVKHDWYITHFPDQLITTEESNRLSQATRELVKSKFGIQIDED